MRFSSDPTTTAPGGGRRDRDLKPDFPPGHPDHPAGRPWRSKTQRVVRHLKRTRPPRVSLKNWMRALAGKGHEDAQKNDADAWLRRKGLRR